MLSSIIINNLGGVCFPESGFRETLFQIFLCLFVIKKVGQQKTLFGSCEKFRNVILFADYIKFGPQTFDCLHIYIYIYIYIYCFEYQIWLGFQESVFLLFWAENTSGSCEKFRNVILFADYIKFDPQTFDCYIYIYIYILF